MSLLRALGLRKKSEGNLRTRMPAVNTFVDAIVIGGPSASLCLESIGKSDFVTSAGLKVSPGTKVNFSYATATGKYRFSTKVTGSTGNHLTFELPGDVQQLAVFGGQKRTAVRLDTTVAGLWRSAQDGKGTGEYRRASLRDISRGGASLITEIFLKKGTYVEIKVGLGSKELVLVGEVMRVDKIETSGKHSHGLRFHGVRAEEDRAIMDFINRRQAELRGRGLA